MYDDLIIQIQSARVAFPQFGSGVSLASIEEAERDLGFPLPESFRWWLASYGGGQLKGDILYGLEDGEEGRPDIVQLARMNERDGLNGLEKLVFCIGNSENFYFDTRRLDDRGEYSVVLDEIGGEQYAYADCFAEFLKLRIAELYHV